MNTNPEIQSWDSIKNAFQDGKLIAGNGLSIAVNKCFDYSKLCEHLENNDPEFFSYFFMNSEDDNYESVIQKLNTTEEFIESCRDYGEVNYPLYEGDSIFDYVKDKINQIKLFTIQSFYSAVKETHCERSDAISILPDINSFIRDFSVVISLNYDLIIYWSIMVDKSGIFDHFSKDISNEHATGFNERFVHKPDQTNVFYIHGNLVLYSSNGKTVKIRGNGIYLLKDMVSMLEDKGQLPLIITEGTWQKKLQLIQEEESYLSLVYDEVLPDKTDKLTIYGCSLNNDYHIIQQALKSNCNEIALSIYNEDFSPYYKLKSILKREKKFIPIVCFDSQSIFSYINP